MKVTVDLDAKQVEVDDHGSCIEISFDSYFEACEAVRRDGTYRADVALMFESRVAELIVAMVQQKMEDEVQGLHLVGAA